jgi:archaellum biogenesis protein FlaJ (TadC family)
VTFRSSRLQAHGRASLTIFESVLAAVAAHAEWLITFSVVAFLIGVFLVPALIVRIPSDYFLHDGRQWRSSEGRRHPFLRLLLTGGKNVLGAVLLLVGIVLLFLPGQGLLTLLLGLTVMNYPGKFEFERWLVRRPHVLPAMNWLRARYGRPPLDAP